MLLCPACPRADSWAVVHINSLARPGATMEGTRLTLVRVPNQPDAYEFSIRTPVTPPRWKDFDVELETAFEGVLAALEKGGVQLGTGTCTPCSRQANAAAALPR